MWIRKAKQDRRILDKRNFLRAGPEHAHPLPSLYLWQSSAQSGRSFPEEHLLAQIYWPRPLQGPENEGSPTHTLQTLGTP